LEGDIGQVHFEATEKVLNNYKITCLTPYLDVFCGLSYYILSV